MGTRALVAIDFINEIVDNDGKLSKARGYGAFIQGNDVFGRVNDLISSFAETGDPVIFVNLGFASDWADQPKRSPIFGKAHEFEILRRGTWSSSLHASIAVPEHAYELSKQRVSAFYGTFLEQLLRTLGVDAVTLCGVATDLAVEAAARDAHDRDFSVSVKADACGAASKDDHERSLTTMAKFASIL